MLARRLPYCCHSVTSTYINVTTVNPACPRRDCATKSSDGGWKDGASRTIAMRNNM